MTNDDVLKALKKRGYDNLVVVAWDDDKTRSPYVAVSGEGDDEHAENVAFAATELVDCLRERAQ